MISWAPYLGPGGPYTCSILLLKEVNKLNSSTELCLLPAKPSVGERGGLLASQAAVFLEARTSVLMLLNLYQGCLQNLRPSAGGLGSPSDLF